MFEAREAVLKAVEKSNSVTGRPKTPPEGVVVLSPEEALAKAEREKKERPRKARAFLLLETAGRSYMMRGKLEMKKTRRISS